MKMIAIAFGLGLAAAPCFADVCDDRHGAIDSADDYINENGHELAVESLLYPTGPDKFYINYCVRNDSDGTYARIKWMGPKPGVLAELPVARGGLNTESGREFVGISDINLRVLNYGKTRSYPFSKEVETLHEARGASAELQPIPAQSNPLNALGYGLLAALEDQELLRPYFEAYAASEQGGSVFSIGSFTKIWLPADEAELIDLAKGGETQRGEAELYAIDFGANSVLDTAEFTNRWTAVMRLDRRAYDAFNEQGVLERFSLSIAEAPFNGLDEHSPISSIGADQIDASAEVPTLSLSADPGVLSLDESVGLTDWTVVLEFDSLPLAGLSFQRLMNQ